MTKRQFYIGIEDLAANALITVLREDCNHNFVSYKQIESYGNKAIQVLESNGNKAVLILSRNHTEAMFCDYSRYFVESECCGSKGIKLKQDIEVDDLVAAFRGYLALDLLLAFVDRIDFGSEGSQGVFLDRTVFANSRLDSIRGMVVS